jgi:hypothetical protein
MSVPYLNFTADSHQAPNLAGGNWFIKLNTENFMRPWPQKADIVNGVIVNMPILSVDTPIEVIYPTPGTLFHKDSSLGRQGYQFYRHEVGYEIAGDTAAIDAELEKDINSRAVFIVGKPDGTMVVLGRSTSGLMIQNDSDSGVEGGENKTTVTAVSNVQGNKKLRLSTELQIKLMSGNDDYGFALRGMTQMLNLSLTTHTFDLISAKTGLLAGRKFAVNDKVEIRRVEHTLGSLKLLPKEMGFATATVTTVSNTGGFPTGFFNMITLGSVVWQNTSNAFEFSPGFFAFQGRFAIQML